LLLDVERGVGRARHLLALAGASFYVFVRRLWVCRALLAVFRLPRATSILARRLA